MASRVIWCLGMYASASTWLFNVTRHITGLSQRDHVATHFFSGEADFSTFGRPRSIDIVKSHEIDSETTITELADRAEKIFITIRDPRDAVTSLMLYHRYEFSNALDHVEQSMNLCVRFATDKRATVWRYETGFFNDPATLDRIAAQLEIPLAAPERERIFHAMSRKQIEDFITRMPHLPGILQDRVSGDRLDPKTHWHTHHAGRNGEIGRWRYMLTPEQGAEIEMRLPHLS